MDTQTNRTTATQGTTADVLDGLNDLLQLDHDALGAYDIAIEKLKDRDHAAQIAGFRRDHERHIEELNNLIAELGGTPTNTPHATAPLKAAMQRLGAMAGDTGALIAWRANELQVRTKYDSYAAKANRWPDQAKRVIDRAALDEERHYHWVADVLDRMGIGPSEGLDTDLATKLRETGQRISHATESIGERVGELGSAAREHVVDAGHAVRDRTAAGIDAAANQFEGLVDPYAEGARARVGGAARGVAGGLHATADFVRDGDVSHLTSSIEGRVRQQPVRTLLTLFAVGFVAGRILR